VAEAAPPVRLPRGIYYGWLIVGISFLGNWITAPLNPVVFSIFIVPIRDDIGVTLTALAWCITIRQISAGVSAPILGHLIDKFGPRWVGVGCSAVAGACLVGLGLSPNIWVMYALFLVSGFSGFGVFGGGQILTGVPPANWFIAKRGRAVSFAMMGMGLGTASWVIISAFLVTTIGWRTTWIAYGIMIAVVLIPAYGLFMRRRPEDVGLLPDGVAAPTPGAAGQPGSAAATEVNFTLREATRTPALWLLTLAFTFHTFATNGILFIRVPYWSDLGVSPQVIGLAVATDPFVVMLCTLLFGFMAERYRIKLIAAMGGVWRAASMGALLVTTPTSFWVFAHNITWGVGSAGMGTGQNLLIPALFGRLAQGSIRGFTAPIMIGAGAVSPPIIGFLLDSGVAHSSIFIFAGAMMLGAGAIMLFVQTPRRPEHHDGDATEAAVAASVASR